MTEDSGSPAPPSAQPAAPEARLDGRCDQCGYSLIGLAIEGACPECGRPYTRQSASRLKPWPSALAVCARLGWPIVGMMVAGAAAANGKDWVALAGFIGIWAALAALTINGYFNVRWMLKRSLPEQTRTRGPIAAWRAIGTTICIVFLLVFVVLPLALGVGCLILLSNLDGH